MSVDLRRVRLRGYRLDVAVAAGVAALVLVNALVGDVRPGGPAPLAYLLLLAGPAVLVVRNRAPRLVLVVTLAWLVGNALLGATGPPMALPALVALFTAVRAGHGRFAVAVVVPVLAASISASLLSGDLPAGEAVQDVFLAAGWFVAAGVLGQTFRQWSAYTREVERRAAEAERTREEAALRRAGEERLRIARELHDSLTHAISVIKVQAGVAVHLARKRGEEVPEALLAIQEASGAATRELRATLEVLRRPGDGAENEDVPAGLEHLDDLVARARAAGIPVSVSVGGERPDLPAAVDRAAYRIVQEALTNITRHAGAGAAVRVRIRYGERAVAVGVEDDGQATPAAPPVSGTGLLGMRERVTALGGELVATPRDEGGFAVHAELPIPEPERAPALGVDGDAR